jgi:hypothetical protein
MYGVHDLIRVVTAVLVEADAKKNLEKILETKIRPDFLEKVNLDSILKPLVQQAENRLGRGVDSEVFKEDLVDMFIDDNGGNQLLSLLLSHAMEKGLNREDRNKVVHGGPLSEELRKKVIEWKNDFGKLSYNFLEKFFNNRMLKWVAKEKEKGSKQQEWKELEHGEGEPPVLDEKELEKQIKEEYSWEEGLIKDIIAFINREIPEKQRIMYKLILKDRFLAKNKKPIKDLEDKSGYEIKQILVHEKKFAEMLKNFLKAQGLGPKFDISEKEIEIPSIEEALKSEENRKDFKEFLLDRVGSRASDFTKKVLEMLVEGKAIGEIMGELDANRSAVGNVKNRYFDPLFEEWYKNMVEDARQVCARLLMAAKTVRIKKELSPEEKAKKEEKTEKEVMKVHETMVNQAIDHHRVRVVVSFSSNYDNMSPATEKEKDADFKWLKYEASIDESRQGAEKEDGTRPEWTIHYQYTHSLNEDGTITEKGTSKLEINGKEVAKDNPLIKYIDDHLERVILKEGAIPHGKFPVEYVNTKTGKHYHGTHDFLKMHEGIFIPDPAHENRLLEKERFETKKRLGPSLDVGEKAEIDALKKTLQRQLKTEDDEENKRKIKEHIKQLDDLLEMKGKLDLDEIEDIIKEEEIIRKPSEVQAMDYDSIKLPSEVINYDSIGKVSSVVDYDSIGYETRMAAFLPGPQSEAAKAMVDLFKGYGMTTKPNPLLWLVPSDLIVLGKSLRLMIEAKLQKEMKAKKPKGIKKDEWQEDLKRIEGEYRKDVAEAQKNFPDFIEDLKTRRDKFQKENPKDFAEWSKGKNVSWVDNKEEVDKVLDRIKKDMATTPSFEKEEKPQGLKMLEKTKWKALEGFLHANQHGFITLGDRLAEASLKPIAGKEFFDKLRSDYEAISKEHQGLSEAVRELMKEKKEKQEDAKDLEEFRQELQSLGTDMKKILEKARSAETIPAIASAEVLKEFSSYFSRLYSIYSGILWFKEKYALIISEENPVPVEEKKKEKSRESLEAELTRLKSQVVQQAKDVGETSLKARDEIRGNIGKMRAGLNKFLDGMTSLKKMYETEQKIHTAAPEDSYEERFKKFVFPEHLINEAEGVVKNLKEKRKETAGIAEKELKEIVDNIITAYKDKEGFNEKLDAVAKKKGISKDKAAIQLKKHEEALAKAAIDAFILSWTEVLHKGVQKERSPLGNKHHTEYDRVGKFIEDHLPDLFKLVPPQEDPKEPSPGIPTPKKIRETIEREWSREREPTPEELSKLYKIEGDEMGFGGGGGGKSKSRPKPAKAPVPSAVYETIKDDIGKLIQHKSPRQVVLMVMAIYVKRVRDAIKNLKEGEYIDAGDVIDGIVYLLKNMQNMVTNLNTHPSVRTFESPSKALGTPSMTGTPDIPIDSYKETIELFDKIKGIYDEVNYYIEPDTVGVPPESLKNLAKSNIRRYLPRGLGEWAQWFAEKEGKAPKPPKEHERPKYPEADKPESLSKHPSYSGHSANLCEGPSQMSFNVAMKFAGMQLPKEEFEAILQ